MKKVKHYICEICGTEYNNKNDCVKCEKGHCKPVSIAVARYISMAQNKSGYPVEICVKMDDGKTVTYKR